MQCQQECMAEFAPQQAINIVQSIIEVVQACNSVDDMLEGMP